MTLLKIPGDTDIAIFICLQFHLNQAKLRSKIRIEDGRGKLLSFSVYY